MTLGSIHGSGTILGSITLAIMAAGQALAAMTQHRPRPEVDAVDHRNPREDARSKNIWLFGA
jgi:hypothetical protein